MDSDEDSLFLLDEEVPEADSVAEDYNSRPISFNDRNQRPRPKWRDSERGAHRGEDNHRNSIYGKSCPAAPIVGSLPTPSRMEDDIPALALPPNSHQEISHMLSSVRGDSSEGEDVFAGGADESSGLTAPNARKNERPSVRSVHFEQNRPRRKTRNVFSDGASSCPAQLHSNFMGGRVDPSKAKASKVGSTSTDVSDKLSHSPLPPRPPTRQQTSPHTPHQQDVHRQQHSHHLDRDEHSPDERHLPFQQGSDEDPDPAILSTSQTALSILQQGHFQSRRPHGSR
jgi:hypothetical protein